MNATDGWMDNRVMPMFPSTGHIKPVSVALFFVDSIFVEVNAGPSVFCRNIWRNYSAYISLRCNRTGSKWYASLLWFQPHTTPVSALLHFDGYRRKLSMLSLKITLRFVDYGWFLDALLPSGGFLFPIFTTTMLSVWLENWEPSIIFGL